MTTLHSITERIDTYRTRPADGTVAKARINGKTYEGVIESAPSGNGYSRLRLADGTWIRCDRYVYLVA